MKLSCYALSEKGHFRQQNEDYYKFFKFDEDHYFVAIADGVGGHERGEVASKMAVQQTLAYYRAYYQVKKPSAELLEEAFWFANEMIVRLAEKERHFSKMGSTLSVLIIYKRRAFLVHVGDTRIYHVKNNNILLLTMDHNLETYIKRKKVRRNITKLVPKNILTQSVGIKYALATQVVKKIECNYGDIFLFTTDGIHGVLDDRVIKSIVLNKEIKKVPEILVKLAEKNGTKDNITCMVVRIDEED